MSEQTAAEARKRVLIYPRQLKDLIAEFGRYDLITPEAWTKWDRAQDEWRERYRADQCAIYAPPDGSIDKTPAPRQRKEPPPITKPAGRARRLSDAEVKAAVDRAMARRKEPNA
jgi:hypothetical protein